MAINMALLPIKLKEYTIENTYTSVVLAGSVKSIIGIEVYTSGGTWEKNNYTLPNMDLYVNSDGYMVLYNRSNDLVGIKIRVTYITL